MKLNIFSFYLLLGIDLINYGLDRIQVSDDGCGINPDDMPMLGTLFSSIYVISINLIR